MIERNLIGLATAIGAAVWLARVVFSRSEHRKLDLAIQALDSIDGYPPTTKPASPPVRKPVLARLKAD